jgi:hypothetical protein
MTILVFPSVLEASASFADEARRWGRRTLGASSVATDPYQSRFDVWANLPFTGDARFFDALASLVVRERVTTIYTPHAPTYHMLERQLPDRLPQVTLMGQGPFRTIMSHVTDVMAQGQQAMEAVRALALAEPPFPVSFLAGLMAQANVIHGECSLEKIVALCGVVPFAPKGDIIEIGALFGKSSYVLNRLASHAGVGATLCVDPWDLGLSVQFDAPSNIQTASAGWDWNIVHKGFLVNMAGCGVPPLNYMRTTSAAAFEHYQSSPTVESQEFGTTELAGSIAVLHLDGNHDEACVAEDFTLWSQKLVPGGWIIFDDYHWPHGDGPRRVADRALVSYGNRVEREFVAGGAMFMKISG